MTARSKRQREVLNFVFEFIEKKGYSPSYQEIAVGLGLSSKGSVARHIEALEAQGLLTRVRDEGGFVLKAGAEGIGGCRHISIPWYSRDDEDFVKPPPVITPDNLGPFSPERLVAYEIEDDAMSEDGILEGDIVFLELRSLATDSEIVLVSLDGTNLVRRYLRSGGSVILSCSNERFEDISTQFSKVNVIGVMRGLLRPLS